MISSELPFKKGHLRFTMVRFNPDGDLRGSSHFKYFRYSMKTFSYLPKQATQLSCTEWAEHKNSSMIEIFTNIPASSQALPKENKLGWKARRRQNRTWEEKQTIMRHQKFVVQIQWKPQTKHRFRNNNSVEKLTKVI